LWYVEKITISNHKTMKNLTVKGAREHNLKDIDVTLPRDKFIVITGISGSGKSTLAFDTIYAEGQRRYVESLSAYARQFLGLMQKPLVDSIEGLSPAISIEQKTTSKNPRSTVGTVTEIYDYLRLLFARVGTPHCPKHNIKIEGLSSEGIAEHISEFENGTVTILAPLIRQKKGTYEKLFKDLNKEGFVRVRVNKADYRTDEAIKLDRYKKHDIDLVIDRLDVNDISRLTEACERASKKANGLVICVNEKNKETLHSSKLACPKCGLAFEELQPRMFSFNSPFGACNTCSGLGIKMEFSPELIIPDMDKSIADGAIQVYRNAIDGWRGQYLAAIAKHFNFSTLTPMNKLSKKQLDILLYGTKEKIKFNLKMKKGEAQWSSSGTWEGLIPQCERLYQQTQSDYRRRELEKYMRVSKCPSCDGKRLKPKVLAVKVGNKSIIDITDMSITQAVQFFYLLKLPKQKAQIANLILKEVNERLSFLENVGLNYLNLSRSAGTLSGGEAQRIRLATQIGSNLTGVLYVLDEPSIGLHQRDNQRLIKTLIKLRDLGNTLIVVEHDEETILTADYVVDMGPGAGIHGGEIVAEGLPKDIIKNKNSLTGMYLSGKKEISVPKERRKSTDYIAVNGCKENNLKNVTIKIPQGVFTNITGVSGSGKSTFMYEILYKGLMKELHGSTMRCGKHDEITYDRKVDKVIVIDQSPIGKTPRSNPATYTKVFDEVRKLFALTPMAKEKGFKMGRFSFNVVGGRCESCRGDGTIKIEMNFLPDVYVDCEECKGRRYNKETLSVLYKGKSIADVLDLSVEEALSIFENIPLISRKLKTLMDVGLSYIKLGQSSVTLSGGEAQRIKLTRELAKRSTGNTVYLLDEPTTGLHFHDIKKLIQVLQRLVDKGNSVVVIEHNMDVIKSCDHIIDLGPDGGDLGGEIVASGTPEEVAKVNQSHTGRFLKKSLK
jgi:excinuclease ABC subunit A